MSSIRLQPQMARRAARPAEQPRRSLRRAAPGALLSALLAPLLCLALLANAAFAQDEDLAALRGRVDAAYARYTEAVERGEDQAAIRDALDQYVSLHAKLGASSSATLSTELASPAAPAQVAAPAAESAVAGRAGTARALPNFSSRLSASLARQKNRVASLVETLRAKLADSADANRAVRTRIELAYLEQEFCRDLKKAKILIDEACELAAKGGVDPELAKKAEEARKAVDAKLHVAGLLDGIPSLRTAAHEADARYRKSSLFRNPFGLVASWVDRSIKTVKYRLSVSKMRECKFEYEKTGVFNLANTGLSFLVDGRPVHLDTTDVFEALDLLAPHDVTDVHLLRGNNESWYARWKVITDAKRSIDLTYFIVDPDVFGKSLLGLLLVKAREGVKVRFMVDAHGTKALSNFFGGIDYLEELVANPNIEIKVYNPVLAALPRAWQDIRTVVGSNHDKIVLVDGAWVITGGRNISEHYFADHADVPSALVDTDVVFRSQSLGGRMKIAFDEEFEGLYNKTVTKDRLGNWSKKDAELLWCHRAMDRHLSGQRPPDGDHDDVDEQVGTLARNARLTRLADFRFFPEFCRVPVQILDKHSFNTERNDISDNIVRLMDGCTGEIIIQNPYIEITPIMHQAMKRANDRGVKIVVHTTSPASTDSLMSQVFFSEDWKNYLAEMPNLRIHAFTGKKVLHAKVFVFDGNVSVIGTYNMDYMSEQINSELVAVILSEGFARKVRENILGDIAESTEYTIRMVDGKPVEVVGPRSVSPKGIMMKLDILRKFKILRPLI